MPNSILDGLSLVDPIGKAILAVNLASLLAGGAAHVFLRARYAALERDLDNNGGPRPHFVHPVLNRVLSDAEASVRPPGERNTQAIIEEAFQAELQTPLLAERFLRAATGLVLILGLLGTFYGLTLSIPPGDVPRSRAPAVPECRWRRRDAHPRRVRRVRASPRRDRRSVRVGLAGLRGEHP